MGDVSGPLSERVEYRLTQMAGAEGHGKGHGEGQGVPVSTDGSYAGGELKVHHADGSVSSREGPLVDYLQDRINGFGRPSVVGLEGGGEEEKGATLPFDFDCGYVGFLGMSKIEVGGY